MQEVHRIHIKRNDTVEVISGKDRGKRGKVLRVFPSKQRAIVEKLNMIRKHMKPSPKDPQGGILELESAIHVSNLMVICPNCGEPTRASRRLLEGNIKVRACKRCGEDIDKG